jgi:hypothetical protein
MRVTEPNIFFLGTVSFWFHGPWLAHEKGDTAV